MRKWGEFTDFYSSEHRAMNRRYSTPGKPITLAKAPSYVEGLVLVD